MTTGPAGDDSESCLCLVASYSKRAELIARLTAQTQQRVSLSPVLGDFLTVRYLDLGAEPGQVGDRQRPVRRVEAELRAAAVVAGRNHFALIVIDKSATAIEQVLASFGAEPFLAGFRLRLAGIASNDDRTDGECHADIVASPNGAWTDPAELVGALHWQCEDLPRYFAARREPGLTPAELDTLKRAHAAPDDPGDDAAAPAVDQAAGPADLLDTEDPAPPSSPSGTLAPAEGSPVSAPPAGPPVPARPSPPAWLAGPVSRLLPDAPWRRGQQPPPPGPPTPPDSLGLVYFLTLTEPGGGDGLGQDRLRAVLRDVDKGLGAQPNRAYQVKVMYGTDDQLRGDLQAAGLLNRRVTRRSVEVTHFDEVVKSVHAVLRRDLTEIGATATGMGIPVARPTVVLLTTNPPIADRRSVGAFGGLAADATIIWLLPRKSEGLVNPVFADRGPATVLGESDAVADSVCEIVRTGVMQH